MNAFQKRSMISVLWTAQQGFCCYCERPMAPQGTPKAQEAARLSCSQNQVKRRRATLEHLQRQEEGGKHRRDNLALACQECNSQRGSLDWLTYKSMRVGELSAAAD